jgi:hypothetical protein
MNAYRRNAVAVGLLFIVATVASLAGSAAARPIVGDPNYLARIPENETRMFAAILLKFVCAITCAAIALALYPVVRGSSESFALGAAAFRVVEGTFLAASAVTLLLLVSLSHEAATSSAADSSYFAHSGALLLACGDWLGFVASVLFFGVGALLYYWVLYQSELIPRWLSGWGLVSASLCLAAAVLVTFQVVAPVSTPHILLNFPIFLQEMVLAVWLIARGFDPKAVAAATSPEARPSGIPIAGAVALSAETAR